MVRRLDAVKYSSRRKRLIAGTLVSAALFTGLVVLAGSLVGTDGYRYGGISCAECQSGFVAYHGHLIETAPLADADQIASMQTHLKKCSLCRGKFKTSYPDVILSAVFGTQHPLKLAGGNVALKRTRIDVCGVVARLAKN